MTIKEIITPCLQTKCQLTVNRHFTKAPWSILDDLPKIRMSKINAPAEGNVSRFKMGDS